MMSSRMTVGALLIILLVVMAQNLYGGKSTPVQLDPTYTPAIEDTIQLEWTWMDYQEPLVTLHEDTFTVHEGAREEYTWMGTHGETITFGPELMFYEDPVIGLLEKELEAIHYEFMRFIAIEYDTDGFMNDSRIMSVNNDRIKALATMREAIIKELEWRK